MSESTWLVEFDGGHWHVYNENGGWSVTGHGLGTPLVAVHVAKLMTAYQQDSRVIDNGDGSFTLLDPSGGNWRIRPVDGGFVAEGVDRAMSALRHHGTAYVHVPTVFHTAPWAIMEIIGDPQPSGQHGNGRTR